MNPEFLRINEILRELNQAMLEYSAGNREQLFESRDILRELIDRVGQSPWQHQTMLCESTQKLLGYILRHGYLPEAQSLELAQDILRYLELTMTAPVHAAAMDGDPADGTFAQAEPAYEASGVSYQMVNETRLGEVLMKMGKIDHEHLNRALVLQKVSRKRLGEVLISMGIIDVRTLQEGLECQRLQMMQLADCSMVSQMQQQDDSLRIMTPEEARARNVDDPGGGPTGA